MFLERQVGSAAWPQAGRTRAAGPRAAALTTRSWTEEQRLQRVPHNLPRRTSPAARTSALDALAPLPPFPGSPSGGARRLPSPAGPSKPSTRVGRFPAPRATHCPPSNLHGRPLIRLHRDLRRRHGSLRLVRVRPRPAATYLPAGRAVAVAFILQIRKSVSRFSAELSMALAIRSAEDRLPHALRRDELLLRGCPSAAAKAEGRPAAASGFLVAPPDGARLEVAELDWLKSGRGSGSNGREEAIEDWGKLRGSSNIWSPPGPLRARPTPD
ncbi:hypothetical protein MC885_010639 [Smutsia gigantea]|nr:hypothetical protein MC885_010639 [Smutsia gigantea]